MAVLWGRGVVAELWRVQTDWLIFLGPDTYQLPRTWVCGESVPPLPLRVPPQELTLSIPIAGPMISTITSDPTTKAALASKHPWNSLGTAENVAEAALFLAGDEA